ncbi:MAG: exodeoxyribonuclease V subunit beta [Deltaproteobacteria bacterium]|nr:exodeoxyribonuclease V subunit beta [Deltaproteobacteria bacterium]
MQVLDSNDIALTGTHLIEASAGTGKTYTITTLVLRLLVEGGLPIDAICVVTFTEAATAELRDRIRTRIKCVLDGLSGRPAPEDPFLSECAVLPAGDQERYSRRLQQALSRFDEAAIYTIHGFCRRLLCDFAYESGMQFDTELVTAQDQLVQETVDDFWRRNAATLSPLLSAWLLEKKIDPDALAKLAGKVLGNPLMHIVPAAEPVDTAGPESSFAAAFQAAARLWSSHGSDVKNLLLASESLNKGTYKSASIEAWVEELGIFFSAPAPSGLPPGALEKFSVETLEKKCKKNCSAPQHPFFEVARQLWAAAEHLCASYDAHILYLKTALCAGIRSDITRRKHADNIQFFDDLLLGVHASLQGPGGPAFAQRVRDRFKAALIDEFQDTDQLQYEIFKNIFAHPGSALFFIGDPKQAIYSFRSADVFTYLTAAADAGTQQTLTTNWRSTPGLIRALELLFSRHASAFVFDQIPFVPVQPAGTARAPLMIRGTGTAPLQVRLLDCGKERNSKKGALLTPQARAAICADMAREIAVLLDGNATLDGRVVEPADIAVLVRTHSQARMVQTALRSHGIACIVQNSGNVFASPEAADMALVLAGVAAPDNARMVRSALATRLLGCTAGRLQALDADAAQWMSELERFVRFNRLWSAGGFSAMLRGVLLAYNVLPRLAGLPAGERSITNVLHLAELLQERSTRAGSGMWELQRWFTRQLSQPEEDSEANLLRLESDRRAVRIMTMFKSKGLEFEIVFCPFTWGGSKVTGAGFVYHEEHGVRALDLGSVLIEEHRLQAETEELAENLRLLYVALTRARRRCCLYWGALPGAGTSAPAWLLHNRDMAGPPVLAELEQRFFELSDADIFEEMQRLAAQAPECIEVCRVQPSGASGPLPAKELAMDLACRTFAGRIHMPWRITSFSALVSGRAHEAEVQERDSDAHVSEPLQAPAAPHQAPVVPPGAHTGTMLHAVLERFTFARTPSPELESLVAETLAAHQLDHALASAVIDMVCRSAVQPLSTPFGTFCLADTEPERRVSEMGFHLPLKHTSSRSLQELFSRRRIAHVPAAFADTLGRLVFSPVHGFLKGFIDLVFEHDGRFYLIDWKSNLLGSDQESYCRERLGAVMARDYYILQYHLYALALHAWLGCRMSGYDYEKHFGGVFYVFLRGLREDSDPDCGVFYDRPEYGFMQAMAQALIDTGEAHAS